MKGICAFCQSSKELCESHTIPSAFGKNMKEEDKATIGECEFRKGVLYECPTNVGKPNNWYRQDLPKRYLLCQECEGLFNKKYDHPILKMWKSWKKKSWTKKEEMLSNREVLLCKKFIWSVIWRDRPIVEIKIDDEEFLNQFEYRITATINKEKELFKVIVMPIQFSFDYDEGFLFMAGGFVWECLYKHWTTDSSWLPTIRAQYYLQDYTIFKRVLDEMYDADITRNLNSDTLQGKFIRGLK
jgi:hypothetical protein